MNKIRRNLARALGTGIAAIPLLQFPLAGSLRASEGERLSADDPTAVSLAYTHQSENPSRRCSGCQFYTGASDAEWGPCVIFPGKLVSASGHCTSWFARSG